METSIRAVGAGTFNNRFDTHLTMSPLLVDELGRAQVTKALQGLEDTLERVEADLARRRPRKGFTGFRAAFLLSSFQAPHPEVRRQQRQPS
jgi:hypothetical protein